MQRSSLLKNGSFELADSGVSLATVTSGTSDAKIAAGWYFTNTPGSGTNFLFTPTIGAINPGYSIAAANNPKNAASFSTSGSETTPGTSAKAFLYQRIYGTREESQEFGCFSFFANSSTAKIAAIEIRRNYGSAGSTEEVVGRTKIFVPADSTFRRFSCTALFPDYKLRTFGAGDYIEVRVYLQAGTAVFTDSATLGRFIDHVTYVPSATGGLIVTAAKFELNATPTEFIPELDDHFSSEFVGRRLVPVAKYTASAEVRVDAELNVADTTSANIALTLPLAKVAANRVIVFKRISGGANTLTVTPSGSDTIDGAGSLSLPNNGDSTTLTSDGITTWRQTSSVLGSPAVGSVTSVALTAPAEFSVAGSPITTSGTLAVTKATQAANKVWAGPTTGADAVPAFRALVSGDIPALSYVTSVALTAPNIFSVAGTPVTSAGTLAVTLATQAANKIWSGPTTGADATPTFRSLVSGDIPSLSYVSSTTTRVANTILAGPTTGADAAPTFRALVAGDIPSLSATYLPLSGGTLTGVLTAPQLILSQTALTYGATTDIDFDLNAFRTLALTGNVTFTTSDKAAGKTVTIKILADGSTRNFTFPAWIFVGAAAPASIAANKTAILSLTCFSTTDASIVAAYAVEP